MTMDAVLKQVGVITETFARANAEIERFRGLSEDFGIDWRTDMNAETLLGENGRAAKSRQQSNKSSRVGQDAEKALPGLPGQ